MKGGIAVLSHAKALEFHRAGHQVLVVASCLDFIQASKFDDQQPFPTVRFSGRTLLRELQIGPVCWRQIRRFKPDVIWSALWYPAGVAVSYVAPPKAVQAVSTYGSEILLSKADWKLRLKYLMGPWRRRVFDKCKVIFALSRYTRERIIELGAPVDKIDIVRGGVDLSWFDLRPCPPPPDRPVLLTVARLDEHKGHDRVIEALPQVVEAFPGLIYNIVGPDAGNWQRLQALASCLGVARHVKYLGSVGQEELQRHYQEATIFIMASREIPGRLDLIEGFGLTFVEAAAAGLVAIAGDSGGVPDAVEHEVSGLLVEANSSQAIGAAILRLLEQPQLRERLANQARRRALQHFTWTYLAGQMLQAFEQILDKTGNDRDR